MVKQKDKLYMPMGTGGLLRYQEEEEQLIKIKPRTVVALVAVLTVAEIVIKIFLLA